MDDVQKLRAELQGALLVLDEQIRGLHTLQVSSISPDLLTEVNEEIVFREHRRELIQAAIDALDALVADGYPELPPEVVSPALYAELQGEKSDMSAAIEVFVQAMAAQLSVDLGQAEPKPQR